MEKLKRSILITGASSGIGRALAEAVAAPEVAVGLIGRDADRLRDVADYCRSRGAVAEIGQVDVADREALRAWVEAFDRRHPTDLLIVNAGVTAASGGIGVPESRDQAQVLVDINFVGAINSVYATLPWMQQRKRGQIALVSSLAAWRGMALTPVYCATKAAVKAYGEALRDLLGPTGIRVSIVFPGFVDTAMSERFPGPRPQMISAQDAAKRILHGLERDAAYIAFPWSFSLGMKLLSVLPFGTGSFFLRLLSLQPRWP